MAQFSEIFITRKADALRVFHAMQKDGVKTEFLRERRGAYWLRFHGPTMQDCQKLWKQAQSHYFKA